MGAARFRSGGREIDWKAPPSPEQAEAVSGETVKELDYAQQEQVVADWLERQGLNHEHLQRLIQREMEALSA